MSSEALRALYQDVLIDHYRRPRNYGPLAADDADRGVVQDAEGYNALCGDRVHVEVRLDDDHVADIAFTGESCAICTASASAMTECVKGETLDAVDALSTRFRGILTDPSVDAAMADAAAEELGDLGALLGVRAYPMRVKCATLPWHTLAAAIAGDEESVSTE
ncbi:MAG: Fe-S cluster assembly sulfur transfer protein SufU [Acidobacteriota bacterium]